MIGQAGVAGLAVFMPSRAGSPASSVLRMDVPSRELTAADTQPFDPSVFS
jgi:hypothetical protein